MTVPITDLNKRATLRRKTPRPLWYVDDGKALFTGPLTRNSEHAHSVPVYLAGLYGNFQLRIRGAGWHSTRCAVIPPGIPYEFDMEGSPLAVIYLEPLAGSTQMLVPLVSGGEEHGGALLSRRGEINFLRDLYESRDAIELAAPSLDSLTGFLKRNSGVEVPPYIREALAQLYGSHAEARPVGEMADVAGLSASRFQHVFTQSIGVPYRRFRTWCRIRAAIREVVQGSSLTNAAHVAGFADQAHLSRQFRQAFGAPPTAGLTDARRRNGD